ncbi:hypothetical protein, partial [Corallococcus carmarthensis]|uniref:hypothetical protein n=2 Tax=Myxococcaceae TaxID=31 RepID=UPI001C102D91
VLRVTLDGKVDSFAIPGGSSLDYFYLGNRQYNGSGSADKFSPATDSIYFYSSLLIEVTTNATSDLDNTTTVQVRYALKAGTP